MILYLALGGFSASKKMTSFHTPNWRAQKQIESNTYCPERFAVHISIMRSAWSHQPLLSLKQSKSAILWVLLQVLRKICKHLPMLSRLLFRAYLASVALGCDSGESDTARQLELVSRPGFCLAVQSMTAGMYLFVDACDEPSSLRLTTPACSLGPLSVNSTTLCLDGGSGAPNLPVTLQECKHEEQPWTQSWDSAISKVIIACLVVALIGTVVLVQMEDWSGWMAAWGCLLRDRTERKAW